ncbi:hypothetical protein CBM2633_A110111 [Cupriavidus taiwanensis]|nr:hypothetical protein CBM2633_A110111 [Cupriavidus taiwanensis]
MDPHEGMVCRQFLIDAEIDALTMQRRAGRAVYRTGLRAGWKFSDFLFFGFLFRNQGLRRGGCIVWGLILLGGSDGL